MIDAYPRIGERERLNQRDFAARLVALYEGPKCEVSREDVIDCFPWMYQVGLLDFEERWHAKAGHELALRRKANPESIRQAFESRNTMRDGMPVVLTSTEVSGPAGQTFTQKKKKRCCDARHIVKSKKTGKRRCKNCNTEIV